MVEACGRRPGRRRAARGGGRRPAPGKKERHVVEGGGRRRGRRMATCGGGRRPAARKEDEGKEVRAGDDLGFPPDRLAGGDAGGREESPT